MHKRKLLVRDWFYFVVWSIRLKKILKTVYRDDSSSLIYLSEKYKQMFKMCFDPQVQFEHFRSKFTDKESEIFTRNYITKIHL